MSAEIQEELEVVTSIYGDNVSHAIDSSGVIIVSYSDPEDRYTITFRIREDYPQAAAIVDLRFKKTGLTAMKKALIVEELNQVIGSNIGQVIIFQSIEVVKERIDSERSLAVEDSATDYMDAAMVDNLVSGIDIEEDIAFTPVEPDADWDYRSSFVSEPFPNSNTLTIFHGPVTVERKSSFQSHLCAVTNLDDVHTFHQSIIQDKRFARATHNIFAYRFTNPLTGVVHHDCDDDGETAAGGRLAEMLRLMGAHGVAVIVSRWFGGTLLGPDRFKFICNSARKLLEDHGYGTTGTSNSGNSKKKSR